MRAWRARSVHCTSREAADDETTATAEREGADTALKARSPLLACQQDGKGTEL
jgi:hypothetical protein